MKFSLSKIVTSLAFITLSQASSAALLFDQEVTPDVIFGTGNANGSFTVDRNNGVELGLRGKLRHDATGAPQNVFNSNGDGTYSFAAGVAPTQSFPTAVWSFEWSINSDYLSQSNADSSFRALNELTYVLGIDSDPSETTSFSTFDPINTPWADHAIGDNTTGNGGGTTANLFNYGSLIAENNVAQNSWKAHWFLGGDFDPTVDATYDFFLEASDDSSVLARTEMQIIVGSGGSVDVPEPGMLLLFGLGFAGLGFARRQMRH